VTNSPETLPSCLNVTAHVDHRFGGLTTSLPAFCDALESTGRYRSPLSAFCLPDEHAPDSRTTIFPAGRLKWMTDGSLKQRLSGLVATSSAVHIHGIWQEHSGIASRCAQAAGKPYLVSVHGMLEPWARRAKRWKKDIYWNLCEKRNLEEAHCLRALTQAEAGHYRSAGLRCPIAVIPNGVDIPSEITKQAFFDLYPQLQGQKLVLFLGRLHRKKGIDILCESFASICRQHPDAHLILAGPDSEDTKQELETQIRTLGIESRVTFCGMLRGNEKWAALRAANVFVLPSHSEGFSVAVLEAMGAGTPVIVSHQCYFPEVESSESGWLIDPEAHALTQVLNECLALSEAERQRIGSNGRRLAQTRFSWDVVGKQTADVLDWIRGGSMPSSVEVIK